MQNLETAEDHSRRILFQLPPFLHPRLRRWLFVSLAEKTALRFASHPAEAKKKIFFRIFQTRGSAQRLNSSSFSLLSIVMAPVKSAAVKKSKVVVDCSAPAGDKIFDVAAFEKYLHDRIKVDGRTNNLGDAITITRSGNKVTINANIQFSKRYVKYLTKRFLKKNQIRDWLRVIATDKQTFELRYFNIANEGDDEDEE